jgi:hypothetical protein
MNDDDKRIFALLMEIRDELVAARQAREARMPALGLIDPSLTAACDELARATAELRALVDVARPNEHPRLGV